MKLLEMQSNTEKSSFPNKGVFIFAFQDAISKSPHDTEIRQVGNKLQTLLNGDTQTLLTKYEMNLVCLVLKNYRGIQVTDKKPPTGWEILKPQIQAQQLASIKALKQRIKNGLTNETSIKHLAEGN